MWAQAGSLSGASLRARLGIPGCERPECIGPFSQTTEIVVAGSPDLGRLSPHDPTANDSELVSRQCAFDSRWGLQFMTRHFNEQQNASYPR